MNTQDKPSLAVSLSKEWPAAELVPVAELIMDSAVGRLWLAAGPWVVTSVGFDGG